MANRGATATEVGSTQRQDIRWLHPLAVIAVLGLLVIYATWAASQGASYCVGSHSSFCYSLYITPGWWRLSPAFLVIWGPPLFSLTCYHLIKEYYCSFY